ncbi:hypothetical protein ACT691_08170 [Vibrio metschnikovii]
MCGLHDHSNLDRACLTVIDAIPTSEGLAERQHVHVVHSSLAVLALDFVLTALMFGN